MTAGQAEKIMFPCGSLFLEGLFKKNSSSQGVVISHPHPLYGGDMHNSVVEIMHEAFDEMGWTTLRFNFRGVGQSQGNFDDGRGEQEDVAAAIRHLQLNGITKVTLAGYSFGAWVNAQAASTQAGVLGSILVSPPLAHFPFLMNAAKILMIITGDSDPFCPLAELEKLMKDMDQPPPLKIISGADHFYSQGSSELRRALKSVF